MFKIPLPVVSRGFVNRRPRWGVYAALSILAALALADAAQATTVGAYSAATSQFYLTKPGAGTVTPTQITIKGVQSSWKPVLGAGTYQFGLYDPQTGTFHFRLESYSGYVTKTMQFEGFQQGWLPVAGDWDGDLAFGVGLYDPQTGTFYLKNKLASGPADITVRIDNTTEQWLPLVGDWDGDGITTVGAYNPGDGQFNLRNANTDGPADLTMQIQGLSTGLRPVAADWDNDGIWSPGLYNPVERAFYWRNTMATGPQEGGMKLAGIGADALPVTRSVKQPTPAVTEVGAAFGTAASATIGAGGGTLRSSDNGVLLTVPPGALAADTKISIQPITNHAQGGNGMAYRFLPNGQLFKQPVKLTFSYSDSSLNGSSPKFLGGAFQTREGYWNWIDKPVVDTAAKTVTISTTHFTDFAQVKGLTISPKAKSIMVNDTVALAVGACYESLLAPLDGKPAGLDCKNQIDQHDLLTPKTKPVWAVNGAAGGGPVFGTVAGGNTGATYKAPAIKPAPQVVSVSATYDQGATILVSNIEIRDTNAYRGYVKFQNGSIGGTANVTWKQYENLGDIRGFKATGSIEARFSLPKCEAATATIPVYTDRSYLKVFTGINEVIPYRYGFNIMGDPKTVVNLTCYTDEGHPYIKPMYGFTVSFEAATCTKGQFILKYKDDAKLGGSIDCSSVSSKYNATWSFKGFLQK